jgi:hypothetical protein
MLMVSFSFNVAALPKDKGQDCKLESVSEDSKEEPTPSPVRETAAADDRGGESAPSSPASDSSATSEPDSDREPLLAHWASFIIGSNDSGAAGLSSKTPPERGEKAKMPTKAGVAAKDEAKATTLVNDSMSISSARAARSCIFQAWGKKDRRMQSGHFEWSGRLANPSSDLTHRYAYAVYCYAHCLHPLTRITIPY